MSTSVMLLGITKQSSFFQHLVNGLASRYLLFFTVCFVVHDKKTAMRWEDNVESTVQPYFELESINIFMIVTAFTWPKYSREAAITTVKAPVVSAVITQRSSLWWQPCPCVSICSVHGGGARLGKQKRKRGRLQQRLLQQLLW